MPRNAPTLHAEKIVDTLRSAIEVQPSDPIDLVAQPQFWNRCRKVIPGKVSDGPEKSRIFVDGFAGACRWNSLQVYTQAAEDGLSIWYGYALYGGTWYLHAWCMLSDRIVESTTPFQLYFGAALTAQECDFFMEHYGKLPSDSPKRACVITIKDGSRKHVTENVISLAQTIGQERDWRTGAVLQGLGRQISS